MKWPLVKPGSIVDVIAPSGKIEAENIPQIRHLIESMGLQARIPEHLLGDHPFCANTDEQRLAQLQKALYAEDSTLIWCVRGGHGVTRILPAITQLQKPKTQKLLTGFSDITSLHLWFNQAWHWPSLHGMMARQAACWPHEADDLQAVTHLWFDGLKNYSLPDLQPINEQGKNITALEGTTIGTCLSLLQTSMGTPWQVNGRDKIFFLEDINETSYRVDRALVHLANAGVFDEARAIVFGDFGENLTNALEAEYDWVLKEFTQTYLVQRGVHLPAYRLKGFGHAARNKPIPLGVKAKIVNEEMNWRWRLLF